MAIAALTLFAIIVAIIGAKTAIEQIEQSSIQSWENHLDSRRFELSKILLDDESIRCIYKYDSSLDERCERIIFENPENLSKVLAYAEMSISYIVESMQFSEENREQYYKWNLDWISSIKDDRFGLFAYTASNSSFADPPSKKKRRGKLIERAICVEEKSTKKCYSQFMKKAEKYFYLSDKYRKTRDAQNYGEEK